MANQSCFENLAERLTLHSQAEYRIIDEEIEAIKRLHASKGLLKSSATIKKVIEICIRFYERKCDHFNNEIETLPFHYRKSLKDRLLDAFEGYFPADFELVDKKLKNIIEMTGGTQFEARYMGEMHDKRENISQRLKNNLDQFVIKKKENEKVSNVEKVLIFLEIICLIIIAFLAGKWSIDPHGNYEPYIVIFSVITPVLEIGRRIYKKIQHNNRVNRTVETGVLLE